MKWQKPQLQSIYTLTHPLCTDGSAAGGGGQVWASGFDCSPGATVLADADTYARANPTLVWCSGGTSNLISQGSYIENSEMKFAAIQTDTGGQCGDGGNA